MSRISLRLCFIFFLVKLLLGFGNAWACPSSFSQEISRRPEELAAELERLAILQNECISRADYHAFRGQLLLKNRRPGEALESLERALLINPDQPGVQLDFATALAETGDMGAARALAEQLLARDDVPGVLRQTLQGLKNTSSSPTPLSQDGWQMQGYVQTLMGFESNLNSAPYVSTINLTLPNGNIPLSLDASSQPQAGASLLYAGQLAGLRLIGDRVLSLGAEWRERQTSASLGLGYRQQELTASYRPISPAGWYQRLSYSHFDFEGATRFDNLKASAWRESGPTSLTKDCRYRAGLEVEYREFRLDELEKGRYFGGVAALLCVVSVDQLQWSIHSGRDAATNEGRAGGDQRRREVRVQWQRNLDWGWFGVEWGALQMRDDVPYSALLGGEIRSMLRKNLKLSLSYPLPAVLPGLPLGGRLSLLAAVEVMNQGSSIELFKLRNHTVNGGLRYEF